MFAILAQMHERYLVWAVAASAVGVAAGVGPTLLFLFLTGMSWLTMADSILNFDRLFSPKWKLFMDESQPGLSWAVLACALVYLYIASTTSRTHRRKPVPEAPRAEEIQTRQADAAAPIPELVAAV